MKTFEGEHVWNARFYTSDTLNIERLASDLEHFYRSQGYQVQQIGNNNQVMVQLKKGGDLESLIGMQAALTVTIQRTAGGVIAAIGQQKWVDKAAVGVVGHLYSRLLAPACYSRTGRISPGRACQPGYDNTRWNGTPTATRRKNRTCSGSSAAATAAPTINQLVGTRQRRE